MIVVFGSNVLDLFFDQENLPPKDQALFLDSHIEEPGGKGANQAIASARAGSQVSFHGALGDGGHGRQMYKNLAHNKIDVSGIEFLDMPSGLATIFVDESDGTHRIVVSQGANIKAKQDSIPDSKLTEDTVVLVQGELPIIETEKLIVRAKARGARTVMNFAPAMQTLSENLLNNLDVIVLNEYEAETLGRQYDMEVGNKENLAKELQGRFDLVTIITLGGEGSITATSDDVIKIPALKITPIDTVGAGDAFTGYLAAALDQKKPLTEAVLQANIAGSLTCTKVGAQTALPYFEEVLQYKQNQRLKLNMTKFPKKLNETYDFNKSENIAYIEAVNNYSLEEDQNSYSTDQIVVSPWGTNQVVETNDNICVKKITVFPNNMLSLQRHRGRAETWEVEEGTLVVIINGERHQLIARETIELPKGSVHCMINNGDTPVTIKETQTGICREMDNIRLVDFSGRPTYPLTTEVEYESAIIYCQIQVEILSKVN